MSTPTVSASGGDNACDSSAGFDVALTISAGLNNGLFWYVFWSASATVSSVVWDPAGANQSLTSVGAAVHNSADNSNIQAFYLANPTAGSSKVVRVTLSSTQLCWTGGFVATGVDQTTPVRASSYTSNVDANNITITSQADDLTSSMVLTASTVTGTDQTLIAMNDNGFGGVGFDYAVPSGNVTHTWSGVFAGSPFASILGFSIKASVGGGGGGTPAKRHRVNQ